MDICIYINIYKVCIVIFASGEKGIKMCVWRNVRGVCDRKKKNTTAYAFL